MLLPYSNQMQDQSNPSEESNRKQFELSKILGHHSEKFAKIAHSNNDFVANYLIGFLSESDLRLLQEKEYLKDILHGMVALKWQLVHEVNYEFSYAKLHELTPITQPEFNELLKELLLLPKEIKDFS